MISALPGKRVPCSACHFPLEVAESGGWEERKCGICQTGQSVLVFPAIRGIAASPVAADATAEEGQATCFFHEGKPAVVPCGNCGRFLCDLCDLQIDKNHVCTLCVQAAREERPSSRAKPKIQVRDRIFLPQNMAVLLAFYSPATFFGLYLVFLSAPAAIYYSIRYWNHGGGIQRRGQWRFVVSLVMGLIQIASIAGIVIMIVWAWAKERGG